MKTFLKNNWPILLIILVAIILRFWQLGTIPPGLHPDEAANGQDIIRMIDQSDFKAIYDTNGPREALFFYLQGFFVYLGKLTKWSSLYFTPLSLRIAPAIIGVLTVWGLYLLGKEFFNKNVGLFAAAALAVSSWHVQFSRNGFRAIMAPFALVFLFYFFIRAYREGKLKDWLGFGIFLAIGFYTYLSFRMVPLVFIALLIYILIANRNFFKDNFKKMLITFGLFLLLMVPMFIHFYFVPADILGRSSTSIFNEEINGGSPIRALTGNIVKTLRMFNVEGDMNWRHNVAAFPMLDPLAGVLFWIGLIISLLKIKDIEHFTLIMWVGALSLPEVLTAEGIPHALRIVGVIPVVFLWVGLAADFLLSKIKLKYVWVYGLLTILVISGTFTINRYFVVFPASGEAGDAYAEDMVAMAKEINSTPKTYSNFLITGEYGTKTVDFLTHEKNPLWKQFEVNEIDEMDIRNKDFKIYITPTWMEESSRELAKLGINGPYSQAISKIDGRVLYYLYTGSKVETE